MAEYPIPPWIRPPADVTGAYAQGAQLAQQRQQAAVAAAQRAQEQAQRTAMAQAELAAEVKKQEEAAQVAREELEIKRQVQESRDREAANIFSGIRGLESDIASGLPPEQALFRNARMFMKNPAALAQTYKAVTPMPIPKPEVVDFPGTKIPPAVQMGSRLQWPPGMGSAEELEFKTKPVYDEEGNVIGRGIQTGPRSGVFKEIGTAKPSYIERGKASLVFSRLKKNYDELSKAEASLPQFAQSPKALAATQATIQALKKQIADDESAVEQLSGAKTEAKAPAKESAKVSIRLRRKSDGKVFRYSGKREDVPTEQYEILE